MKTMVRPYLLNLLIDATPRKRGDVKTEMVKGEEEFLKANLLCDEGRYEEAIVQYQSAIKLRLKDDKLVYNNMGVAYDSLGHHEKALDCYRNAVELDPDYEVAWYNMGNAFSYLRDFPKAIRCYSKALQLNPDYRMAEYDKGLVLAQLGKVKKALETYEEIVINILMTQ